jgi:NADH dehydrogenase
MADSTRRHRILILGGGFGGLYAALALYWRGVAARADITLVNASERFLFTPLLYELLTEEIEDWHIAPRIRDVVPRSVRCVSGDVVEIDAARKRVAVRTPTPQILECDSLILALGSESPRTPLEFPAGRRFFFRTLDDAQALVRRVHDVMARAREASAAERARLLSFAVIGAGPSGVEVGGKLADALRRNAPKYGLDPRDARITLLDRNEKILRGYGAALSPLAERALAERTVRVRLGAGVASHTPDGVLLENGERVAGRTLIWTAGGAPPQTLESVAVAKFGGRIIVGPTLETPDQAGVYALGDNAFLSDAVPMTAQVAVRQAQVVAANIDARLAGRPLREYEYVALGEMLTLGRAAAAANIFGLRFDGCPAHVFRRLFYLSSMPSLEHAVRVGANWTGRAIDDFLRSITPSAPSSRKGSEI